MAVELRDLRSEDKGKLLQWRNKPEVARFMYTDHHISEDEHSEWFTAAMDDPTRRYWIIVSDGQDVGLANLYNVNPRQQRCHWAFYIAEEGQRGKGVGSWVEYLVLSRVFDEMKLNKLCCEVLASNLPVVNHHKGFGFQQEGYFRQHVFKGAGPADIYCLAMLREEWEALKPRTLERLQRTPAAGRSAAP